DRIGERLEAPQAERAQMHALTLTAAADVAPTVPQASAARARVDPDRGARLPPPAEDVPRRPQAAEPPEEPEADDPEGRQHNQGHHRALPSVLLQSVLLAYAPVTACVSKPSCSSA